jgi:hypothetical protein
VFILLYYSRFHKEIVARYKETGHDNSTERSNAAAAPANGTFTIRPLSILTNAAKNASTRPSIPSELNTIAKVVMGNNYTTKQKKKKKKRGRKSNYTTKQSSGMKVGDANHSLSSSFFVNNIMTTRGPMRNSSCHRPCFDFRNKIYFLPPKDDPGAGLIDRLTIFGTLLNMAGYFCARVYTPRPRLLLDAQHNANRKLDANMSWSEFGDFVLWNDPLRQPALIEWDNATDLQEWPSLPNGTPELFHYSARPVHVKNDFQQIENFTLLQQSRLEQNQSNDGEGFLWVIAAEYFNWCNLVARLLLYRSPPTYFTQEIQMMQTPTIFGSWLFHQGCQYAKVGLSANLQHLQQRIVSKILQPSPSSLPTKAVAATTSFLFGYLHIRRQDALTMCNTSLARMESYLNCSLGDSIKRLSEFSASRPPRLSLRTVTILFSSDEKDPQYRSQILQLIQKQQQHYPSSLVTKNETQVVGIDLDELVERTIQLDIQAGNSTPAWRLNNYQIFQLILSIGYNQTIVKFHLEQRREEACSECTNVTDQLIKSGMFGRL